MPFEMELCNEKELCVCVSLIRRNRETGGIRQVELWHSGNEDTKFNAIILMNRNSFEPVRL